VSDQGLSVYDHAGERVALSGVGFDRLTEAAVVTRVMAALAAGHGGRIVTPNVDILRLCRRGAEARAHVAAATYVVADGMPLVWASRLRGAALPERVAGSSLIWTLSSAAAGAGRSVYLLGGEPGAADRAAEVLTGRHPGLRLAGTLCPEPGFDADPASLAAVHAEVVRARPDIVYAGLGFPKQERLIARLAPALPATWFVGCGAAIGFAAGTHRRAPQWMQRTGLEWLHRLGNEPTRLFRRYVIHDAPFALRLLATSAVHRRRTGSS
jgi:N-acetylglucosaminyldiphosphoundecaprenol N-acetyl-beta-D-mannosaminyltransferase